MQESQKVILIQSKDINHSKWDACIRNAANGTVYAYAWYLDMVCEKWEALVANDYEIVMPLPYTLKLHLKVIRQPSLTPQLGFFSTSVLDEETTQHFLNHLPTNEVNYTFNAYNRLPQSMHKYTSIKSYRVIDLIPTIESLEQHFTKECRMAIESLKQRKITVIRAQNPSEYMAFRKLTPSSKEIDEKILERLLGFTIRYKSAGTYGAYNQFNELIAQAFILKSNNRLFLIDATSIDATPLPIGILAILYRLIRINAESNLTLEFPFHSHSFGKLFSGIEHECLQYKRGWMAFLW